MARLLVTGGAGFIGANFVHYWLHAHPGERVIVLDLLTYAGNPANLDSIRARPEFRFVHASINDTQLVESLLAEERIDCIVNFAAESHVDRSITGPDAFVETNIVGTHSLLKAARSIWLAGSQPKPHRFHHVSTDEVYGSLAPEDPAFTEESVYAPNSPYAASKAASDHLVRAYHHTYGLSVTASNCSNNYGPYQFPEKLIPLMIVNALRGRALPVYGDGLNVRDWLYVEDHCRAIDAILRHGKAGVTYNVGGNSERTNREVVDALCAAIDTLFAADLGLARRYPECPAASNQPCKSLLTFVADRPGHDRRYAINATRLEAELGIAPSLSFELGLETSIKWYVDNPAWWQPLLARNTAARLT